jgi:endonuclease/exonuclease/phosphatase family metal-dependent hydrolase
MRHLLLLFLVFVFCFQASANEQPLRIVSWNIKFLPRHYRMVIKHHPLKRAKLIPEVLKTDSIDIICFQEAFDKKANQRLINGLKEKFPYMVGPANEPKRRLFKLNSGVMFMSRYPLKNLGSVQFSDCENEDCVAQKGGLLVEAEVNGQAVQILGTHMDAGENDEIRVKQVVQLEGLLSKFRKQGTPQVICGDFNVDRTNRPIFERIKEIFNLDKEQDGEVDGSLKYSYDPGRNDMNPDKARSKLIDFMFYRDNGVVASQNREIVQYQKPWKKKNKDLSDHFALKLELWFKRDLND